MSARHNSYRVRRCPTTGKRRFKGRDQAMLAIAKTRAAGSTNQAAYTCPACGEWHLHRLNDWTPYRCPDCHGWHLTSNKPRCPGRRAAA